MTKSVNKKTLEKNRQKLLAIRRSLIGDVGSRIRDTQELGTDGIQDIADQATGISTHQILIDLSEKERNQLKLVEKALEKINNGTYGICDRCEGKIPAKRLEAMPFARYCVACQSEIEKSPSEN